MTRMRSPKSSFTTKSIRKSTSSRKNSPNPNRQAHADQNDCSTSTNPSNSTPTVMLLLHCLLSIFTKCTYFSSFWHFRIFNSSSIHYVYVTCMSNLSIFNHFLWLVMFCDCFVCCFVSLRFIRQYFLCISVVLGFPLDYSNVNVYCIRTRP